MKNIVTKLLVIYPVYIAINIWNGIVLDTMVQYGMVQY